MEDTARPEPAQPPRSRPHFLINVLWSWLVTITGVLIGFFLNPFIVRRLGEERYGIWALVFAMLDYLWFFDLGFNTAVTNFIARFQAQGNTKKINEVINTALCYFSAVAVVLMLGAVAVSQSVGWFFPNVQPVFQKDFSLLLLITGVGWGGFVTMHIFASCLDAFQRFDLTSRSWTTATLLRSSSWVVLLWLGYGLVEMGIVAVIAQAVAHVMNIHYFRRVFPELRISPALASRKMIREMIDYGIPSFFANTSTLMLYQAAPLCIGRFQNMAGVGYFTLPMRLLQAAVDAVSRVGIITRSNTAEREASGRGDSVLALGIHSNRYCFTLFTPLVLFLLIYGRELIRIWITPSYAENSYPVLQVTAPAIALVLAGQFNSSSILFGLGIHKRYAHGLMVEAGLMVAGLLVVVPRWGIVGAAWLTAVLMIIVRGIYTPWLVTTHFRTSFSGYMAGIYGRPLLTAIPVAAAMLLLKQSVLPGGNWVELGLAASLTAGSYLLAALFTSIEPEHRSLLLNVMWRKWRALRPGGAHA